MAKVHFENYTPADALALANQVHAEQGFVKSGMGYTKYNDDGEAEGRIYDNKTVILEMIKDNVRPTEEQLQTANEQIDAINGRLMLKKMSYGLNSFEDSLTKAISQDVTNYHISIIASIPNSIEVDKRRAEVSDKLEALKPVSEHIGKRGERFDMTVEVIDCKYIQSSGVYMITTVHNDKNVVKFWWRDQPDVSDIIQGKKINIRGTVNKHEINKYALNIKETMVNRVKINL